MSNEHINERTAVFEHSRRNIVNPVRIGFKFMMSCIASIFIRKLKVLFALNGLDIKRNFTVTLTIIVRRARRKRNNYL